MKHDPRLQDVAGGIVRAAEPQVPAALLLSELERRCVTLKVASGGERIDALFARLDEFAVLAADLTDCL